jgi:hypothetical protein
VIVEEDPYTYILPSTTDIDAARRLTPRELETVADLVVFCSPTRSFVKKNRTGYSHSPADIRTSV